MKQAIGNACGSIAVIHAIGNNLEKFELDCKSFLNEILIFILYFST
jgi:hypothetical protein